MKELIGIITMIGQSYLTIFFTLMWAHLTLSLSSLQGYSLKQM